MFTCEEFLFGMTIRVLFQDIGSTERFVAYFAHVKLFTLMSLNVTLVTFLVKELLMTV